MYFLIVYLLYRSQVKEIHMMFAVTLVATFIVVMLDYNCKMGLCS